METTTYGDIIGEKISEWQTFLEQLEKGGTRAAAEAFEQHASQLKDAVSQAIAELRDLDAQETIANTVETKNKILKIFDQIDRQLQSSPATTPFML